MLRWSPCIKSNFVACWITWLNWLEHWGPMLITFDWKTSSDCDIMLSIQPEYTVRLIFLCVKHVPFLSALQNIGVEFFACCEYAFYAALARIIFRYLYKNVQKIPTTNYEVFLTKTVSINNYTHRFLLGVLMHTLTLI